MTKPRGMREMRRMMGILVRARIELEEYLDANAHHLKEQEVSQLSDFLDAMGVAVNALDYGLSSRRSP